MDNLKYYFAKTFNKVSIPLVFLTSLGVGSGTAIMVNDDLDNYTTPETISSLANINQEMQELEKQYLVIEGNKNSIKQAEVSVGKEDTMARYKANNKLVDDLSSELKDFEYDLMFSGLSETNLMQVIEEYNGLKISNINELIHTGYIDNFNDRANNNPELLKYPLSQEDREAELEKEYIRVKNHAEDNDFGASILALLSAIATFVLLAKPHDKFVGSERLKRWGENKPGNRRKKLNPAAKNNSNTKSL